MVQASVGIADETPQLLVTHPQTSQVPKSKNHILPIVSNTVTDSDTPDYPPRLRLDILLRHQPLSEGEGAQLGLLGDSRPPGPKAKQVAPYEFVLMRVILIHKHKGTLASAREKIQGVSNSVFEQGGSFVHSERPAIPETQPLYWVMECVLDLHLLPELLSSSSSRPGGVDGPAASLLELDPLSGVVDLLPVLLLQ
jgi:hypothetical protein